MSVSLPEEDVRFLDAYARADGCGSRSAAVHRAVRLLRTSGIGGAYEDAWREWAAGGDSELWEVTAGDGLPF